jgi:hypothetical protein
MEIDGTTSISSLPISNQVDQMNSVVQSNSANSANSVDNIGNMGNIDSMSRISDNRNTENIKIDAYAQREMQEREKDARIEQKTYNQLVSGLQQASAAGQTSLPTRDIPQETAPLVQDEQIKPNFIPQASEAQEDYISNDMTMQNVIDENKSNAQYDNNLENLYAEFQLPILVAVLYFLFQLPAIQKYIYKIIPGLFNVDGNANLMGYLFNSIAFGLAYLFILKMMRYFSNV